MRPKSLLRANTDDAATKGTIILFADNENIELVCTSLEVNASAGEYVSTLAIVPPLKNEEEGVVGIRIWDYNTDRKFPHQVSFLLRVYRDENGPHIDLEKAWAPHFDRLGQIVENFVTVKVGDEIFVSSQNYAEKNSCHYVPDGNLICRYLNKKAEEDELRASATLYQAEKSAREQLPELLKKISETEEERDRLGATCDGLGKEYQKLIDKKVELMKEVEKWKGNYSLLFKSFELTMNRLKEATRRIFFIGMTKVFIDEELKLLANLKKINEDKK